MTSPAASDDVGESAPPDPHPEPDADADAESDGELASDAGPEGHPLAVRVGAAVAAAIIVVDQVTKELAERVLEPGVFVSLLGPHIGWQLVYNPGGAFGLPAPPWVFLLVTMVVVAVVMRSLPRTPSLWHAVALGLILAGALGNMIDRVVRPGDPGFLGGWVVDFIAWGFWPRFNVADSAITVGVVLLFVALLREELAARRLERAAPDADGP